MTTKSEQDLWAAYRNSPSIAYRNQLAVFHQALVKKVSAQFSVADLDERQELEAVGYEGLIRAIERFDSEREGSFKSYATAWIRGEILRYFNRKTQVVRLPASLDRLRRQLRKLEKQFQVERQRSPTQQELIEGLGISPAKYAELQQALRSVASLDAPLGDTENFTLGDTLAAVEPQEEQDHFEDDSQDHDDPRIQQQKRIREILDRLPAETRQVVEWAYVDGISSQQIAQYLDRTQWDVEQYLAQGLEALRLALECQEAEEQMLPQWRQAPQAKMDQVLGLVEAAIDRLVKRRQTICPATVAQEANLHCHELWQHPKALSKILQRKTSTTDIPTRIQQAVERLSAKGQRIDLKQLGKESGIPQYILRRHRRLLSQSLLKPGG